MTEKGDHFFRKQIRVTLSVTAPGDTNLSDVTVRDCILKLSTKLQGPHDIDDIFKVIGSKFKVTENIFQKYAFQLEAYRSTVCYLTPSSSHLDPFSL